MRNAPTVIAATTPKPTHAARDEQLVSILLSGATEPRQLARCLRALLQQAPSLPARFRGEILVAVNSDKPAIRRVLNAAQRSAPEQLALCAIRVDAQRPLDALRDAARGARIALLPVDALPQPQWLRAGLEALAASDIAAAYGVDDRAGSKQLASSIFIRADVFHAIAPGRFHAGALQRSIIDWCGASALRAAPQALTTRDQVLRRLQPSIAIPAAQTAAPASRRTRGFQLTQLATAAAIGIAITAGFSALQAQAHGENLRAQAANMQLSPMRCAANATQNCTAPQARILKETRLAMPTRNKALIEI